MSNNAKERRKNEWKLEIKKKSQVSFCFLFFSALNQFPEG